MDIHERNKAMIEDFRSIGGKVGSPFTGRTLLLLHTTGAKSKDERINPVAYTTDGDRIVIIASKGGAPTDPYWYHNVVGNPHVTIEVGTEKFQARAAIATEPERTRLYDQMAAVMPGCAEYQRKNTRRIPAIVLPRTK